MIDQALAAAALALGDDAAHALARLGGPLGDAARARLAELLALDPTARRPWRAAWMAAARVAVPPGLRAIHVSWIEAAVAGDPAARAAVAASGGDEVAVWRARWATAGFAPMPPMAPMPPAPIDDGTLAPAVLTRPADAVAAPTDRLAGWLVACGAEQLAAVLSAAELAAAAQRSPDAAALHAAGARRAAPGGGRDVGPRRALIQRCAGIALTAPHAVAELGARAIAPHLDGDDLTRWRLALRLPRDLGAVVARGLAVDAPVAARTPWATLAAAW